MSQLVQYLVIRNDLLNWNRGSLIAQACHASIAVIWKNKTLLNTINYCEDADNMRKIVLGVNEEELAALTKSLTNANVVHKTWIEQPENIPTCIAVSPGHKTELQGFFEGLKLFK